MSLQNESFYFFFYTESLSVRCARMWDVERGKVKGFLRAREFLLFIDDRYGYVRVVLV